MRRNLVGLALIIVALWAFMPATAPAQSADGRDQSTMPQQDRSSNMSRQTDRGVPATVDGRDQATMPQQDRSSNTSPQTDRGVQATVTGVDRPDECLRIRREPSGSSDIIRCAKMNERLLLSGNYSRDGRWAELADKGWVFAAQIDAPNKPKVQSQARQSAGQSYETYDTDDFYSSPSDSSVWRESSGPSYGTDTGVVYGGPYGYGPRSGIGIGFSGGGYQGGGGHHRGGYHGGGGQHGVGFSGGGYQGSIGFSGGGGQHGRR